ncbi:MAG: putative rane protein [Solirubrobacteraceae bacterium]|jgi:putative copper resistance protein D|nr:putative rane protein [Solirubrobacteraceae bacterium]
MKLALDPVPIAGLLLAGILYVRAVAIVTRRGLRVSRLQQVTWWIGLSLQAVALLSPLSAYSDQVLSAHMGEHLLLGDVAAPLLLAGARAPVLLFLLPRGALVALAHRRGLRRAFKLARRPLVALPVYVAVMYGWHVSTAFEGAVRDPFVHALQHASFVAANLLLWWPVLEPQRRRTPGDLWKIGYVFAARMSTMFLGMVFVFSRGVLYSGVYGTGPRRGLSPFADQQTAGGTMMTLDIVIMVLALCYFFWHAARESIASEQAEQRVADAAT